MSMIAAMCYRVKYRKTNKHDIAAKQMLSTGGVGVHRKNRGGVYPSGIRVRNLAIEVLDGGFAKEEVNHACVAVEELSLIHI